MWYLVPVFCLCAVAAQSQTLVAAKNLRAQSIIGPEDLVVMERSIPGTYGIVDDIIGMEARVTLYAGRPIRIDQIGPPAVIERNQIVTLLYRRGGLSISRGTGAWARWGWRSAPRYELGIQIHRCRHRSIQWNRDRRWRRFHNPKLKAV